ncbi:Card1-like endonuclease domain-containing protein [Crassaminicella indica]|uniref:DUF1887 family protein n=1 Tax=Crassaminicella indica TaxID=2855394 RepID=A0ABX8R8K8_9CLOT|nr:DUF1887 family CARF protein [Crassaminicella indica]QXM05370.1 DUF1887 family protein [Crassaminicella indica]
MTEKSSINLVVCSTLNQITNYLTIIKYRPKKIFNITFHKDILPKFNINIKPHKWDKQLKETIGDEYIFEEDIKLSNIYDLGDIKEKLKEKIIDKLPDEEVIYWNVTGGQRTIALAISELIREKNRKKDRVIYIEGNTEKLIYNNYKGELINYEDISYKASLLNFDKALSLVGFKCNSTKIKSTMILKKEGVSTENEKQAEYSFYKALYKIVKLQEKRCRRKYKISFDGKEYNDCFRNLLLKINTFESGEKRQMFAKELFNILVKEHKELKDTKYFTKDIEEIKKSYPAGYIFEKLTAYKIYEIIKNNHKIIGMETSLKIYFNDEEKPNHIIDELDIVLLTDTGKIINFECKSGGMKGDNAKSHKYTTYRLSGVFGMPILLSPLYYKETLDDFKNEDEILKNQLQAFRAAKAAELEVFTIDKIEEGLKKLGYSRNS